MAAAVLLGTVASYRVANLSIGWTPDALVDPKSGEPVGGLKRYAHIEHLVSTRVAMP